MSQVFYVVPRINQIEEAWLQISRCVPEARVAIGHSKVRLITCYTVYFIRVYITVVLVMSTTWPMASTKWLMAIYMASTKMFDGRIRSFDKS